jgi:RNA binding exosome subunit
VGAVLSSGVPIAYIELRVFAHATEDVDRVLAAARNLLPSELVDVVSFERTGLGGHYGNPIVLFEAKIKDKKVVQAVFEKLCSELSVMDRQILSGEIMQHVDRGNLFLRLDKQSAFLNEFRLGSTDPIHLRIHFRGHGSEEIVDVCSKLGLLP